MEGVGGLTACALRNASWTHFSIAKNDERLPFLKPTDPLETVAFVL